MSTYLTDSPLLAYWLKANGYLVLFYACYWLLLRRHTFLNLNRIYLLTSVGLALLLPLVNIPGLAWAWADEPAVVTFSAEAGTVVSFAAAPEAPLLPDWPTLAGWLFCAVALGMLLRTGWRTGRLLRLIRQWPVQVFPDHKLVHPTSRNVPTFSFFRYLILNPDDVQTEAVRQHELVHIRQRHSVDIVLLEVLQAFFWPNPALFGYRRAMRQVHEYVADRDALAPAATDRDAYARFLLDYAFHLPGPVRQCGGTAASGLTHSFGPAQPESPTLKQRIQMLYQQHTSRRALWKYALVLPLATALLAMTTRPELAPASVLETVSAAPSMTSETPAAAEVTAAFSSTVLVEGRVIDKATRKPLPGANIVVKDGTQGTTTDSEGNFRMVVPSDGPITLVASFVGFASQKISVKSSSARIVMSFSLSSTTTDASSMPMTTAPSTATAPISGVTEIFTVVEQQPMFPGGMQALFKFVSGNLQYPEAARRASVSGTVFVQFIIDTDGSTRDVQILKGIGFGCDAESVRLVKSMPKWIPGQQSGRPVTVRYNLPISFQFSDKKTGYIPSTGPVEVDGNGFPNVNLPLWGLDTMTKNSGPKGSFRVINTNNAIGDGREPLYLIDGKKADKAMLAALDHNTIQSINVLKNGYAKEKYKAYGDEALYGVVEIFTKKKE